jgi:hypothetical protein
MGGVVIGKRAGLLAGRFFLASGGKSHKEKNGDPDRSSVFRSFSFRQNHIS